MCFLHRSFGDRNSANILQVISNWLIKSPMRENKYQELSDESTVIRVDASLRVRELTLESEYSKRWTSRFYSRPKNKNFLNYRAKIILESG